MNKQDLQEMVELKMSVSKIAKKTGKTQASIRYWMTKFDIKPSRYARTSAVWTTSREGFAKIVKSSTSIAEILRSLGYDNHLNSALYRPVQKRIKEEGLDISHIVLGRDSNKNRSFKAHTKESFLEKMAERKRLSSDSRDKLIKFNIIPHTNCAICNNSRAWNKKPLTLQVDHIDGDSKNNNPDNLRFICPNCHSQTDTFCIGNRKIKEKKKCVDCDSEISQASDRCQPCAGKRFSTEKEINKKELTKMLVDDKLPYTTIAKHFNMSDNGIRKKVKRMGYDPKTRKKI